MMLEVRAAVIAAAASASLVLAVAGQTMMPAPAPAAVPGDWPTTAATAQRDGWLRGDPYISLESMAKGGFGLQWKLQLEWKRDAVRFTGAAAAGGRKPLTFLSDTGGRVWAIDSDTGLDFWKRDLAGSSSGSCGVPLSAGIAKSTALIAATAAAARGGRFGPAVRPPFSSVVAEPGAGLATILMGSRRTGATASSGEAGGRGANAPAAASAPGTGASAPAVRAPARGNDAPARGGRGVRAPAVLYALGPDGVLHVLGDNSGIDVQKPVPFLNAGVQSSGLSVIGSVAYVLTSARCPGGHDGVAAIDLASETKEVVTWKANTGTPVGAPAFGQDGTVYLAIDAGTRQAASGDAPSIVALDPRTLKVKDWFTHADARFASMPVVIRMEERDVVVATSTTGRVFLLDSTSLGGTDHQTPAFVSKAYGTVRPAAAPASWRDTSGVTWLLLPVDQRVDVTSNPSGAVLALKVTATAGRLGLDQEWASRTLTSPWSPIVVNGVVFALSSGTRTTASQSSAAVLYALDPLTGRPVWDSGKTIPSAAGAGVLLNGNSQIHVTTAQGAIYAFGFAMERR